MLQTFAPPEAPPPLSAGLALPPEPVIERRASRRPAPRSSASRWMRARKRVLDVASAGLGLLALSPLLGAAALWVKLDSSGPALFSQVRVGRGGRWFRCLKFRTMRADAEEMLRADPRLYQRYVSNDYKLPVDEDPRITKAGRFLRRTSLDELPQLVNVLRGEMSLVGPRPIVPAELEQYGSQAALLLSMRPGMTGEWAANGRGWVGYPARAQMELEYVVNWSLRRDVTLLLRTVLNVFHLRSAR